MAGASKVFILTLGCAKNSADSASMSNNLAGSGFELVQDIGLADVAIVNTCAFIQSATEESIDAIFDVLGVVGHSVPVVVCGCMPSRYGEDLKEALTEVATFVPCEEEKNIAEILRALLQGVKYEGSDRRPRFEATQESDGRGCKDSQEGSSGRSSQGFAYVKIAEGCSRRCSFCTIPDIRGPYKSFSIGEILSEVDSYVSEGVSEIVLVAQDSAAWGRDLGEGFSLAYLLSVLAAKHPHTWFRVMYLQPDEVDDKLISTFAQFDNICNYFDIPIQHVSSRILKAMNRGGSSSEFASLIHRIRETIPSAVLRTTLIAGFPGETDEEFEELRVFVESGLFDYVGIFEYSREEGTRAAEMDGQIPKSIKLARANELRRVADGVCTEKMHLREGSVCKVLVSYDEDTGEKIGRGYFQAPEVDGVCFIKGTSRDILPGTFIEARLENACLYDLDAEFL